MRKLVQTHPTLPFSAAAAGNGIVEISGQIGLTPEGSLVEGVEAQTRQALDNMVGVLKAAGCTTDDVLKVRIYLTDMKDYPKMNEIYAVFFPSNAPSRVALAVKGLPLGALVEIECTAAK